MATQFSASTVTGSDIATSIAPIRTKRIYMEVVDRLCDLIRQGDFPDGSALPPERDLAEAFEVSRSTLREALTALELMGLIRTRHGHGRFVSLDGTSNLLRFGSACMIGQESPFALVHARKMLEPQIAAEAARLRSDESLASLWQILESAETQLRDPDFDNQGDRLLHAAIADATQNPVIQAVMQFIAGLMEQGLWRALDQPGAATPEILRKYWVQHRAIVEAIAAKDAQAAFEGMLKHLSYVELVLAQSEEPDVLARA